MYRLVNRGKTNRIFIFKLDVVLCIWSCNLKCPLKELQFWVLSLWLHFSASRLPLDDKYDLLTATLSAPSCIFATDALTLLTYMLKSHLQQCKMSTSCFRWSASWLLCETAALCWSTEVTKMTTFPQVGRWRCLPPACRGCISAISGGLETPICPCNTH